MFMFFAAEKIHKNGYASVEDCEKLVEKVFVKSIFLC